MGHIEAQRCDNVNQVWPCGVCHARSSGVCSAVPQADLGHLAALATAINVRRNQMFIDEEAPAEHCHIITHGSARLYKQLPDGRRQIVCLPTCRQLPGPDSVADLWSQCRGYGANTCVPTVPSSSQHRVREDSVA